MRNSYRWNEEIPLDPPYTGPSYVPSYKDTTEEQKKQDRERADLFDKERAKHDAYVTSLNDGMGQYVKVASALFPIEVPAYGPSMYEVRPYGRYQQINVLVGWRHPTKRDIEHAVYDTLYKRSDASIDTPWTMRITDLLEEGK